MKDFELNRGVIILTFTKDKPWVSDKWFVSPLNYLEEVRKKLTLPSKIIIHDVTLRDGEQEPGIVFTKEDKIKIARKLDEAGVGRIEAGMPLVSEEDREAIRLIVKEGLNAKIFAFTRAIREDIDAAVSCGVDGVTVEIPVSDVYIRKVYKWTEEQVLEKIINAISHAKEHGLYATFFMMDLSRANLEWTLRLAKKVVIEAKADSVAIVDTYGALAPEAMKYLVNIFKTEVKVPIEVHTHNDLGLAVANAIAAVTAGAEIVHVSVNGLGERAGNADISEVVLALELLYNIKTGLKIEKLYELSTLVQELSGVKMPPHKAVVGNGIFKIESGLPALTWLRVKDSMPLAKYSFLPSLVGQPDVEIMLGKKSGKANIEYKAKAMGYTLTDEQLNEVLKKVKELSLKKKGLVSDREFREIITEVLNKAQH